MRPPKVLVGLALLVLIPQLAGCYHYLSVATAAPARYDKVHVALHSGETLELTAATVDSLNVTGYESSAGDLVEVPIEEVERVYARKADKLGFAMLGATVLTAVILVVATLSWDISGG